jgi:hypothetical protein
MNRISKEMVAEAVEHNKDIKLVTGLFLSDDMSCACALSHVAVRKIGKESYAGMTKSGSTVDSLMNVLDLSVDYVVGFIDGFDNPDSTRNVNGETPRMQGYSDGMSARELLKEGPNEQNN